MRVMTLVSIDGKDALILEESPAKAQQMYVRKNPSLKLSTDSHFHYVALEDSTGTRIEFTLLPAPLATETLSYIEEID